MHMAGTTPSAEPEFLCEVSGGVGCLTLNRPRALNALTPGMVDAAFDALSAWAHDEAVEAVQLQGSGRGFCSGADVRWIRDQVMCGDAAWERFFEREFALDALIARYPKPITALMRGVTMGGGLGLSAHASRRVVDASSRLAMPETVIGYTPDVGMTWLLARAPGEVGTHLALTGASIGAQDAIAAGLADTLEGDAPPAELAGASWIAECYSGDDPVEIHGRLSQHPDPAARAAAAEIEQRCPLSVAVTLEALRRAAALPDVESVLTQDLALARTMIPAPDFAEGVRAQLVDKDRRPRWRHSSLVDVSRAEVLACFEP